MPACDLCGADCGPEYVRIARAFHIGPRTVDSDVVAVVCVDCHQQEPLWPLGFLHAVGIHPAEPATGALRLCQVCGRLVDPREPRIDFAVEHRHLAACLADRFLASTCAGCGPDRVTAD